MLEAPPPVGLTYAEFHLFYTIPVTIGLWFIVRPFMDINLRINAVLTSLIAVVYTTPWDNLMVWSNTWGFAENGVTITIGYIPLEEYSFFVIQTLMQFFWTTLCLRWALPVLYLPTTHREAILVRWTPLPFFAGASILCWIFMAPETPLFYFHSLISWTFPVIGFLWYGAGNYVYKRFKSVLLAISIPTAYLITIDGWAIDAGIWYINPLSVSGIYIKEGFPIEEACFFLLVNVVIVFAYCAFEKSMTVLHNFPEGFQDGGIIRKLFQAFFRLESTLSTERVEDLDLALAVLRKASKSFWAAGFIFPAPIREDLSILYAFCRVTDDMVDDISLTTKEKQGKLDLIKTFLKKLFEHRKDTGKDVPDIAVDAKAKVVNIDWSDFKDRLSPEELAAFRSLSRIAYQLPAGPLYELCLGYEWDIERKTIKTFADCVQYSGYVASTVGVLCTFIMANKARGWFTNYKRNPMIDESVVIRHARDMGVALQLTNIARDIVTDSETLGRCYVPEEFLGSSEMEDLSNGKPWGVGETTLRKVSLKILDLADEIRENAALGIKMLPPSIQPGVVAATGVYTDIGNVIREHPGYPKRASVSTLKKVKILLRALYFSKV